MSSNLTFSDTFTLGVLFFLLFPLEVYQRITDHILKISIVRQVWHSYYFRLYIHLIGLSLT